MRKMLNYPELCFLLTGAYSSRVNTTCAMATAVCTLLIASFNDFLEFDQELHSVADLFQCHRFPNMRTPLVWGNRVWKESNEGHPQPERQCMNLPWLMENPWQQVRPSLGLLLRDLFAKIEGIAALIHGLRPRLRRISFNLSSCGSFLPSLLGVPFCDQSWHVGVRELLTIGWLTIND